MRVSLLDGAIIILALVPLALIASSLPTHFFGYAAIIYGVFLVCAFALALLVSKIIQIRAARQAIERQKDEFLSFASHQLRTPLTAMRWRAEMLLSGDAGRITSEQKKFVTEIEGSTKRMAELVNQFLNISRINLGTFEIKPRLCDIRDIIDSVIAELRPFADKKKLTVSVRIDEQLSPILCDPKIVRIFVFNLIANAIAYTTQGSVTVAVRSVPNGIALSVADTGVGIPAKEQQAIFTKLFRADNIREMNPNGCGLGLYIVKQLIERIGGSITFTSQEGVGSVFSLQLPRESPVRQGGSRALTSSSVS